MSMKRSTETLEGLFQKKSTLTYLNNIVKKVQADDISDEVLKNPKSDYTKSLLKAVPVIGGVPYYA